MARIVMSVLQELWLDRLCSSPCDDREVHWVIDPADVLNKRSIAGQEFVYHASGSHNAILNRYEEQPAVVFLVPEARRAYQQSAHWMHAARLLKQGVWTNTNTPYPCQRMWLSPNVVFIGVHQPYRQAVDVLGPGRLVVHDYSHAGWQELAAAASNM